MTTPSSDQSIIKGVITQLATAVLIAAIIGCGTYFFSQIDNINDAHIWITQIWPMEHKSLLIEIDQQNTAIEALRSELNELESEMRSKK